MARIHLILFIATSLLGIRGMDSLWSSSQSGAPVMGSDPCVMMGCHEVIVEVSCCGTETVSTYCAMSNGPCTCGVKPIQDHSPDEPLPLPSRDRDSMQMVRGPPTSIQFITTELPTRLISIARTGSIRAGFSHNQAQALLGVWQR